MVVARGKHGEERTLLSAIADSLEDPRPFAPGQAAVMVGNRGGHVEAFPSCAPKPPRQIHIFPIHEKVAVENLVLKTHALKRARAIDGQRSRRTEDFPRLVVLAIVKFP